jgi:hypothetical protein
MVQNKLVVLILDLFFVFDNQVLDGKHMKTVNSRCKILRISCEDVK